MVEPTQTDSAVRRLCVVSDFFAQAEEMRAVFDERMGRKRSIGKESFVWDYRHIPGPVHVPADLRGTAGTARRRPRFSKS